MVGNHNEARGKVMFHHAICELDLSADASVTALVNCVVLKHCAIDTISRLIFLFVRAM